jgi:hypothetical protein
VASDGEVALTLSGFESRFLMAGIPFPATLISKRSAGAALQHATNRWPLPSWQLVLGDFTAQETALIDWRDIDALRYASGPGVYSHDFLLPQKQAGTRYLLDLVLVQGSAQVSVNGQALGRASIPPFAVDITAALRQGSNTFEIEMLAPLRNAFVGRALAGDPHYSGMENYDNALVAAGLMGPVAVVEVQ